MWRKHFTLVYNRMWLNIKEQLLTFTFAKQCFIWPRSPCNIRSHFKEFIIFNNVYKQSANIFEHILLRYNFLNKWIWCEVIITEKLGFFEKQNTTLIFKMKSLPDNWNNDWSSHFLLNPSYSKRSSQKMLDFKSIKWMSGKRNHRNKHT